ncbi:diamine acetyltransferase 2 isoform X2 [Cephus cinctus]|uniref:Diamine acetyltransferase 2 isoform X2 n=1 Tax=Cephus cinctus TaxID=211228 RepID=A0AAJ7CHD2_CEPCN|nr:diamine acetyltransferase 2 isoform X2 [Cephus cinctus]
MEGIQIREAKREDCKAIRDLIQKLAESSGKSNGAKLKYETLEEDGFNSDRPLFYCYVATASERIIGYTVYYYTYSTWNGKAMYLEDLYVLPEFRKKHVGSSLFKTVVKKAADSNCCRLDFAVLNWNPAREFYKSMGAVDLTEKDGWHHFSLENVALKKLAAVK